MEKRITKRDNFNTIRGILAELNREDLVAFVDHELELLDKRGASKSLTKTQKENLELVEKLYEALANYENPVTITELMDTNEEFGALSNQKVSALMKKLTDTNRVVKYTEKNKSYFSVAKAD